MEKEISALNEIRSFIEGLKEKLNTKIQENNKLNEDILSAGEEITELKTKISELNENIKMLKLASQIDGNEVGSTKDVKLMINEMVREIDKCIALLNKENMSELSIKVVIGGRTYPLTINREDEEKIRKSVSEIENNIKNLKENYAVNDMQDLLAMTALEYANDSVTKNNSVEFEKLSKEIISLRNELED